MSLGGGNKRACCSSNVSIAKSTINKQASGSVSGLELETLILQQQTKLVVASNSASRSG